MSIDIILFSAFLSLNLLLGFMAGRRVKTLREFSIGSKNFSTGTVTSTIVATWIGGGFMFYALQNIYTSGLQFIIALLGGSVCLLVIGQVLVVRMEKFLNTLSVAEAMGDLYGKTARIITAFSGIIRTVGGIAIQFKVIGKMITLLLGLEGPWVTIVAACIVIAYSTFGGIRSVTITDIFQFITFSVFIPILALLIWNNLKNPGQVAQILDNNPLFSWKHTIGWNTKTLSMLGVMLYFIIPGMNPAIFQRIAMAKDVEQARDSFTYSAGIHALIMLSAAWVAILLLADPTVTDPSNLLSHIITQYAYPGLKGLIAVGIVAMAMSTADSDMNATAVLVANDILKPLKLGIKEKESINSARLACIYLGICSLALSLSMQNLLKLLLFSSSFYMPIVTVPFLLAILGFRSTSRAVLIGMTAGFSTVIMWSICFENGDSIIPGMIANIVFFVGSHYLLREQGGWKKAKPTDKVLGLQKRSIHSWINSIKALTRRDIYVYFKKNIPQKELIYSAFALYVIGATYTSFFTVPDTVIENQKTLYDFITHSTLIATAIFITYPAWPPRFKARWFMAFLWPIGVTYLLFVVGSILVMMSGFHQVQVMIFMLNLIIATLLLPWPLVVFPCIISIILTRITFYIQGEELAILGPVASLQFKIFYTVLLFSGSLIAIMRFRQSKSALQRKHDYLLKHSQETSKELLKALTYEERFIKALGIEGTKELEKTAEIGKQIQTYIENSDLSTLPSGFTDMLINLKNRLHTTAQYLGDVSHRATTYLHLDIASTSIKNLVEEVSKLIELTDITIMPQIIVKMENNLELNNIECDIDKIKKLLFNGISYAQAHITTDKTIILLGIEETNLGYVMNSLQGYTKQIPAVRFTITTTKQLPPYEPLYLNSMEQAPLQIPLDQNSLVLLSNQRILQAHYGYMAVEIDNQVATQVYVIPQNISAIRPKEMDIPELEPDAEIKISDESYPGAKEQEATFLKSLKLANQAELKMVYKAINLIKKYHGPVKRMSGEPFYLHPIAVAQIILDYTNDLDTTIAALLHDIVEDTPLTLPQIELMFNSNIKKIVDGASHLDSRKKTVYKLKLATHENIRQLLEVEDKQVLYVKLADRMHNMRTIQYHPSIAKQKAIAEETLQFFVPIAQFLGLSEAAEELKTRSFEVLNK